MRRSVLLLLLSVVSSTCGVQETKEAGYVSTASPEATEVVHAIAKEEGQWKPTADPRRDGLAKSTRE